MRASKAFSSIQVRIAAIFALVFFIAGCLIYFVIGNTVTSFMVQQRIGNQSKDIESFCSSLGKSVYDRDVNTLYNLSVTEGKKLSGRVLILDMDGTVLVDSHSELNGRILRHMEIEDILTGDATFSYGFHRIPQTEGSPYTDEAWAVYYTASIVYGDSTVGAALFSFYIQDVVDSINSAMLQFAGGSVAILLSLFVLSFIIFSHYLSRPIRVMTDVLNKMGSGRFDLRVKHLSSAWELENMANTINSMSEKLENLDKTRNDFVANASHELKTPLSSIKILTESLLYQKQVSEETYQEFLGDINQQIDRMTGLLDDLLVLSQTDHAEEAAHRTYFSLEQLLKDVFSTLQPLAQGNAVKLSMSVPNNLIIYADRTTMRMALENLVTNGIKYNKQDGEVRVNATQSADDTEIQISDTGIGIPKEDQPHVFDRFYRVDKARSRETGGTGLGLSIVDSIIRLHGGTITLESTLGEGTVFTIHLPRMGVEA